MNKAFLIGRLCEDPGVVAGGLSPREGGTLDLWIAVPASKRVGDGWVEAPERHRLTLAGATAEYVGHASAGDTLAVECSVRPDGDGGARLLVDRVLSLVSGRRGAA